MNNETTAAAMSLTASPGFADWLLDHQVSLAFATPPAKLFLVGVGPTGQLGVFERTFDKAMGLAADGVERLWLGTRSHLWRLDSVPPPEDRADEGFDRCYVPRRALTTGYLNTHDVSVGPDGDVLFVATRFGCVARAPDRCSFEPVWQPPFLRRFEPSDRCHLNGLAREVDGTMAFASSVSATDGDESWRDHRRDGGVITHVPTGEIAVHGLSMPHSPRLHGGDLWVTNSGTGHLCRVDPATGVVDQVAFAPGFLRGLCFVDGFAVVGSSRPREGDIYSGLDLDDNLAASGLRPRLGVFIVDLARGEPVEWLFIEGPMRELFDVIALPGVRRPMAFGLLDEESRHTVFYDSTALARDPQGHWQPAGAA